MKELPAPPPQQLQKHGDDPRRSDGPFSYTRLLDKPGPATALGSGCINTHSDSNAGYTSREVGPGDSADASNHG